MFLKGSKFQYTTVIYAVHIVYTHDDTDSTLCGWSTFEGNTWFYETNRPTSGQRIVNQGKQTHTARIWAGVNIQ